MWTPWGNGGMMPPMMPIYYVPVPPEQQTTRNNTGRPSRRPVNNSPFMSKKPKSFKKQLREAQKMQQALDEHMEWLKKNMKKDEKKEEKKDDKGLTFLQKAAGLFLLANICIFTEMFLIKTMLH